MRTVQARCTVDLGKAETEGRGEKVCAFSDNWRLAGS